MALSPHSKHQFEANKAVVFVGYLCSSNFLTDLHNSNLDYEHLNKHKITFQPFLYEIHLYLALTSISSTAKCFT